MARDKMSHFIFQKKIWVENICDILSRTKLEPWFNHLVQPFFKNVEKKVKAQNLTFSPDGSSLAQVGSTMARDKMSHFFFKKKIWVEISWDFLSKSTSAYFVQFAFDLPYRMNLRPWVLWARKNEVDHNIYVCFYFFIFYFFFSWLDFSRLKVLEYSKNQ